jgi:peroxidase
MSKFFQKTQLNIECDGTKKMYRTFDGSCNNLERKWMGMEKTPQQRILRASYDDGISSMRSRSYSPSGILPNPRLLANTIQLPRPTKSVWSNYFVSFGQSLAHDMIHTQESVKPGTSEPITCQCDGTKYYDRNGDGKPDGYDTDDSCVSLPIEWYDVFWWNNYQRCYSFTRSAGSISFFDCDFGVKEQLNAYTSWLDLGFIYGTGSAGRVKKNDVSQCQLESDRNTLNEVI